MTKIKLFSKEEIRKLDWDTKQNLLEYNSWKKYDEHFDEEYYHGPRVMAEHLLPHIIKGQTLLDVGCGTGLNGKYYKENKDCIITGIDISNKSLERANEKKDYSYLEQANLKEKLNFKDYKFDVVLCIGVSEHMKNMASLIYEMARVSNDLIAFNVNTTKSSFYHYSRMEIVEILKRDDLELLEDFRYLAWGTNMYSRGYIARK